MRQRDRLDLTDTLLDVLTKMGDGNPGAMTVLAKLFNEEELIDPDSAFRGMGTIFYLDSYGIYGSEIWILYKDICGQDIVKLIALIRAKQLGLLISLSSADGVVEEVQKRLPRFAAGRYI